jgi:hypothetical protein
MLSGDGLSQTEQITGRNKTLDPHRFPQIGSGSSSSSEEVHMHASWGNRLAIALLSGVFLTGVVAAQEGVWQGEQNHPMLRATFKNKDKNVEKHAAVVEVETQNIGLVTSDVSSYEGNDMGLLEYQVDQAPVLATADTRVMFRGLTSGKHTITVSLVNTQYKELGAEAKLEVDVP